MKQLCLITLAIALVLSGCGGEGSSFLTRAGTSGGTAGTTGGGSGTTTTMPTTTPSEAQGFYSGTFSTGYSFYAIVLPNDVYYAIYGAPAQNGSAFYIDGMMTGQGTSQNGTYKVLSLTNFFWDSAVRSTLTATYVPSTSISGSIEVTANKYTYEFNGKVPAASLYDYNVPANPDHITGTWTATFFNMRDGTVTISSSGGVTGISADCSFSGTITPDGSKKNFFNVTVTLGPGCYPKANQTGSGIAVETLLSDGTTRQLLAGTVVGDWVFVFAAWR